jgi:hypothetical protein
MVTSSLGFGEGEEEKSFVLMHHAKRPSGNKNSSERCCCPRLSSHELIAMNNKKFSSLFSLNSHAYGIVQQRPKCIMLLCAHARPNCSATPRLIRSINKGLFASS